MSNQNPEQLERELLISEILNNKTAKTFENEAKYSIRIDLNGRIEVISSTTIDFIKSHFNVFFKEDDSFFKIIPTDSLRDFLNQFRDVLSGYSTSTIIRSSAANSSIRFRTIPDKNEEAESIEIRVSEIAPISKKDNNLILNESSQKVEILNETSQVFEALFNNHPDAIYSFDLEGYFISANASASELGEISAQDLSHLHVMEFIPEENVESVKQHFQKAAKGELQNYNTGFISLKGTERIINVTNFPIIIDGKTTGVFGIAKDITEAELNKKRSLRLEKSYKTILDQSLDVICTIDENGCFVHLNEVCYEMWGYKPEELYGKPYMKFVIPEDKETTIVAAQEIMSGENKTNFSNRYTKKDGSIVPMVWSVRWVEEEQLMYCIAKNASEMNAVKGKLVEERNILRAIIDNIPDYIYVINKKHETILANSKFYNDFLGKKNESEIIGLKATNYFSEGEGSTIIQDNTEVMENDTGVINRKELVLDHNSKKEVILLTKVPLKTAEGNVIGLVGIARNITENHQFEQEQLLVSKLINHLSGEKDLKRGLYLTIQTIAEYFDFTYAEVWKIESINNQFKRIAKYKNLNYQVVDSEILETLKSSKLIKKTFDSRKINVLENQALKAFQEDGIFIGVPIEYEAKVIEVLIFYTDKPPKDLLATKDVLRRLSSQISNFIQRKIVESQLNNLFQYSPNLIAVIGMDGYLKKVSPSFIKTFGFSEDELLNTPYSKFLHPDEINISFQRLKEVTQGYAPKTFEGRCRTKDGQWRWISWTPSESFSDDGVINLFGLDITSLKMANLEMLKFKNIIESSSEGIGLIDLKTDEVYLNTSFKKALGYNEEELNHLTKIKNTFKDVRKAEEVYNHLLDGKSWNGDIQLINKCKEVLDYQFSGGPIFSQNHELIAVYGIHTDITNRKRYELELKQYSDQVNDILQSITDGFLSITNDWIVTYFNREAEKLLGISKEVILNKYLWDFFPEAKASESYKYYSKAFETGKKVSFQDYFEPYDTWFEINAYPSTAGLSIYFKDITIKKRAAEEIRVAVERYEIITKVTHEATYDWDMLKNSLKWSDVYSSSFGFEIPTLDKGLEHWENQLHPEDKERVFGSLEEALGSQNTVIWENEYRLLKENKEISLVLERAFIIRNQDGVPIRMIGSLQDISKLKHNEIALEKLNLELKNRANELANSNTELEQFAYIASHDLQEPLRMVTSFLTQLNKKYKDQLDPKAQQYIYYATDGAIRMRQILLDLLEYSQVGRVNSNFEEVDLNVMINEISNLHRDLILEAEAEIIFKNLPTIQAASIPLQRVLSNLITNALKYQKSGNEAKIKIEVIELLDYWQINVKDNGIGIEKQFFNKIFVIFQRLHSKDHFSGTGIGLAICKKIIENHGGKIWVTSKINEGSIFHFTIRKQISIFELPQE